MDIMVYRRRDLAAIVSKVGFLEVKDTVRQLRFEACHSRVSEKMIPGHSKSEWQGDLLGAQAEG